MAFVGVATHNAHFDQHVELGEVLEAYYPTVIITHDPDHGAKGNWRELRDYMKGLSK